MGFDVADGRRLQARAGQRIADQPFLRDAVGHREPAASAVLVDRRSENHGEHAIAVGDRVGQPLQHDDADAFAAGVTISGRVERLAPPVRGQHPRPAEVDRRLGPENDVRAAGQRHAAFVTPEAVAGQVHRDQRRRARRVDDHAMDLAVRGNTTAGRLPR